MCISAKASMHMMQMYGYNTAIPKVLQSYARNCNGNHIDLVTCMQRARLSLHSVQGQQA